jgi:GGDEF domain-containing protein
MDAIELRARREVEIAFGRKGLLLDERIRQATGRLADLFEAESVSVHLADETIDRFRTITSSGRPDAEGEAPLHRGLLARVFEAQKSWFLTARLGRPSEGSVAEPLPNLVVAPLTGSRPLGVLSIECVARTAADLEEYERLTTRMAAFIARSIEGHADESELSRRSALMGSLADIAARLMVCRDVESLLDEIAGSLTALFPSGLVTARLRGDGGGFLFRSSFDGREPDRGRALEIESTLARRAVESKRELTSAGLSPEETRRVMEEHGVGAYAIVPIRVDEEVGGILGVLQPAGRRGAEPRPGVGRLDVQTLRKIALYASIALDNVRRGAARGERAVNDPLTGLLAGAGFESRVQDEVKRAERYREHFLLTVCAVHEYDRMAERLGPAWAEGFLKEFGQALRRNVREVDAVARIADARFAVLSPASEKDSGALLRRLNGLVGQLSSVRGLPQASELRLDGHQYSFPDEIATGGELLSIVRGG